MEEAVAETRRTLRIQFEGLPWWSVAKIPSFQCKRWGFDPWSGNEDPTCHAAWPKTKKCNSGLTIVKKEGKKGELDMENLSLQLASKV